MAELVDALASGASGFTAVKVRVLSWAPPLFQVVGIANGDDLADRSDPCRVMMRQIAGAFHQYEKHGGEMIARAKRLRMTPKGGRRSLILPMNWEELASRARLASRMPPTAVARMSGELK